MVQFSLNSLKTILLVILLFSCSTHNKSLLTGNEVSIELKNPNFSCSSCRYVDKSNFIELYTKELNLYFSEAMHEEDVKHLKRDIFQKSLYFERKLEQEKSKSLLEFLYSKSDFLSGPEKFYLLKKISFAAIRSGKVQEAENYLSKALKVSDSLNLNSEEVVEVFGKVLESQGKSKDALELYRKYSSSFDICLKFSLLEAQTNISRSIASLNTCKSNSPNEKSKVHFQLGRFYLENNNLAKSEEAFKMSYKANPKDSKSLAALAVIYEETNKKNKIEGLFVEHLNSHPNDYVILSRLVDLYVNSSQYGKSIKYLEKMTDLNPKDVTIKFKLAYFYKELSMYRKGIRVLEEVISYEEQLDKAYFFLADFYFSLNNKVLATTYLKKVKKESAFFEESTIRLAKSFRNQPLEFEKFYRKTINKLNKNSNIYFSLSLMSASFKEKIGEYNLAAKTLVGLVGHDLFLEQHALFLASLYEKSKNLNMLDEVLGNFLLKSPNSPLVLNYLGYSMIERGESFYKKGSSYLSKALALAPESGYIQDSYGWYLYKVGKFKESIKYLSKAQQSLPNDRTINKHLGQAFKSLNNNLEGQKYLRKARRLSKTAKEKLEIDALIEAKTRLPASMSLNP